MNKTDEFIPSGPDRLLILCRAAEYLANAANCLPNNANDTFGCKQMNSYVHKAEVLIELLEVYDCGSTGGFDKDMPGDKLEVKTLFGRFLWLCSKYDQYSEVNEHIKLKCRFKDAIPSLATLAKAFGHKSAMRIRKQLDIR